MMQNLKKWLEQRKRTISKNEMIKLSKIVIAGALSKKNNNKFYSPKTLKYIK